MSNGMSHFHRLASSVAALTLLAVFATAADARIPRSSAVVAEFKRLHPCPANGAIRGACPGWEVDHIDALCAGGPDTVANMQWLTKQAHAQKTKRDVMRCRQLK